MSRPYRLGKRQVAVDATREAILGAARELLAAGSPASVQAIARSAGVSRVTVYNRFGSRNGVLAALAPPAPDPGALRPPGTAVHRLHDRLAQACSTWAAAPALYRHLPAARPGAGDGEARELARQLAAENALRPGCSIKEAEDVIGILGSFPAFDHLHRDGRRPSAAVAEILMRMAGAILAS